MRAHIIEKGVVVNTIVVESLDIMENLVSAENGGAIGDLYEDGQFITPQPAHGELENKKSEEVRAKRNALLQESDWTQLVDSPVDHATWFAYRQALRDITAQAGFPWTIDWPERP
jgi:Phage tail assembly chaperone protein